MQACAVASTLIRAPCPRPARLKQPRRPAARVAAYLVEPAAPTGGAGAGQAQVQAPVIDAQGFLAPELQGAPPPPAVSKLIYEAGEEYGCFQLVNHGVSQDLIADMKQAQRDFFALPSVEKLKVKRSTDNPNGFADDELTKRVRDLKEIFDFCNDKAQAPAAHAVVAAPNQWPEGQAHFRATMEAYFGEMSRVSFKLLEAFSQALGLPLDTMHHMFQDDHTSFMRLNQYPHTAPAERKMGLNHHTDAGFFTLLIQDPEVHGLQFLKDGGWHDVAPAPDGITVNVGDQCQVMSNDVFKAPVHRVLSPHNGRTRYSAPFFFNPRPEAVIQPLPAFVTPERPPVYNPIPWAHFRDLRYAGDYADTGEEVQIHHFKK